MADYSKHENHPEEKSKVGPVQKKAFPTQRPSLAEQMVAHNKRFTREGQVQASREAIDPQLHAQKIMGAAYRGAAPIVQAKLEHNQPSEAYEQEVVESQAQESASEAHKLPTALQAKMEGGFGTDFSTVNIHKNSTSATDMGAIAYTRGEDIHFAPGEFDDSSHQGQSLIGHELTHVVQQRAGRVQPTVQAKGLAVNDDLGLEREADEMGELVAGQLKSNQETASSQMAQDEDPVGVVTLPYGTFKAVSFEKNAEIGVNITLEFDPNADKVEGSKIALVQVVRNTNKDDSNTSINPVKDTWRVKQGEGSGFSMDQYSNSNNPIYSAANLEYPKGLKDTPADNQVGNSNFPVAIGFNTTYIMGHARKKKNGKEDKSSAWLIDAPQGSAAKSFETAALCLEGRDAGKYLGSVKWGYEVVDGVLTAFNILPAATEGVSPNFVAAAKQWNDSKVAGTFETVPETTKALPPSLVTSEMQTFLKGTQVQLLEDTTMWEGEPAIWCRLVKSKGLAERTFLFKVKDLQSMNDGQETINLPIPE
jgi:Domain of unknown function (DUF4157)